MGEASQGHALRIINSFGAHGGNTTVLLEDAPEWQHVGTDPRLHYHLALSARSRPSMRRNIEAMLQYLNKNPEVSLSDLYYTLWARRMHHPFRIVTPVDSLDKARRFFHAELEKADVWLVSLSLK